MAGSRADRRIPSPDTVFFVNSRAQAEDAISVGTDLRHGAWIVPLWKPVERFVRSASLAPNLEVVSLATSWPARLHKVLLAYRGTRLIRKLLRGGTRIFVFGDDLNQYQTVMINLLNRRRQRCRSVLIQDGLLDSNDPARLVESGRFLTKAGLALLRAAGLFAPLNRVYGKGGCTRIAAFGPSTVDLMRSQGIDPSSIVVTGPPRYDRYFRIRAHGELGKERTGVILCIGTLLEARQWGSAADDRRWLAAVHALARERGEQVIIRPHPTEDAATYQRILAELGPSRITVEKEGDLAVRLRESDAVVMLFPSSVLVEAMIFDKPVVYLDLGLPQLKNDLVSPETCHIVRELGDLSRVLEAALAGAPERSAAVGEFLIRHLGFVDGRNSERAASLIETLQESISVS